MAAPRTGAHARVQLGAHARVARPLLGLLRAQSMVLAYPRFIAFWNWFYGSTHMAATIFVLLYLFTFQPPAYQRCRTTFLVMNAIALVGYACYPLMPPRLLNACLDPYGGCLAEPQYQFVDTMHMYGSLWSWRSKAISNFSNHYAAMPSMHMGYAAWCSASTFIYAQSRLLRAVAVVYPVLTLYCVTITGNHYPLDAVFGLLALWLAAKLGAWLPEVGRGARARGTHAVSEEGFEGEAASDWVGCVSPLKHEAVLRGGRASGDVLRVDVEGARVVEPVGKPVRGGMFGWLTRTVRAQKKR